MVIDYSSTNVSELKISALLEGGLFYISAFPLSAISAGPFVIYMLLVWKLCKVTLSISLGIIVFELCHEIVPT